ncbi:MULTISPECIES: nucleotide exchange factor GrpE [Gordonia]|uniref:Protein GrpE n=1 Tax=Gordonia alkanivorans NBRC 16433 TaxID=1027371 RepID=F9VYT0_9ACTN|nr:MULTISPECIES: nucleotide exchange factor GrpE [Gordonia]MDH3012228.1 nucleotide exchange factor GrpE [Gordonia alkanivorans]MDH3021104.1 nucleotide exchange factor GrpE [Gordonia alkanivorans]MDH3025792.1 nucleotide exchange factor GrpE [Gordonia alkanivorans]WJG13045.1 nucleotide exchange factor GrpE [Gordonia sp. Swx-4]GAA13769.1 protein GrpE [Gordonia alkanivorans NBRC 16433]
MTAGSHSTNGSGEEPVTVTDRRRIDPETGEVRDEPAAGPGPADAEPVVNESENGQPADDASSDARLAELTADLQRERAQFANFRRRAAEEKQGSVAYGKQILIDKLLPVLDDLDRAREHGDLETGPLRAVADKLTAVLNAEGLEAFGAAGEEFNPELHEAVQHDGTGDHPVIGAVYRCGYRLGEKVIRTAMVTVTDPEPAGDQTGAQ